MKTKNDIGIYVEMVDLYVKNRSCFGGSCDHSSLPYVFFIIELLQIFLKLIVCSVMYEIF